MSASWNDARIGTFSQKLPLAFSKSRRTFRFLAYDALNCDEKRSVGLDFLLHPRWRGSSGTRSETVFAQRRAEYAESADDAAVEMQLGAQRRGEAMDEGDWLVAVRPIGEDRHSGALIR
jgi:hypothetical protein